MTMQTATSSGVPNAIGKAQRHDQAMPAGHKLRPELAAYFALSVNDRFPAPRVYHRGILAELALDRGHD